MSSSLLATSSAALAAFSAAWPSLLRRCSCESRRKDCVRFSMSLSSSQSATLCIVTQSASCMDLSDGALSRSTSRCTSERCTCDSACTTCASPGRSPAFWQISRPSFVTCRASSWAPLWRWMDPVACSACASPLECPSDWKICLAVLEVRMASLGTWKVAKESMALASPSLSFSSLKRSTASLAAFMASHGPRLLSSTSATHRSVRASSSFQPAFL
mmetsp:Transcript_48339/g.124779  ORF Transcript_48339/g.124779 Transcript_48339/m.124779 type:complete len:216 (-) Transcript_48339:724-1371(-)